MTKQILNINSQMLEIFKYFLPYVQYMPQHGRGRGCRGRGRGKRWITGLPGADHYCPRGVHPDMMNTVILTLEELEAIRLVDYEGLNQEEAAAQMGVSRKTLWNDLKSGRKKVAQALIHGWAIRIKGGSYIIRGEAEK